MIIINFYHDSIWRRLMVAMYAYNKAILNCAGVKTSTLTRHLK